MVWLSDGRLGSVGGDSRGKEYEMDLGVGVLWNVMSFSVAVVWAKYSVSKSYSGVCSVWKSVVSVLCEIGIV